jgi:hypothetical protein
VLLEKQFFAVDQDCGKVGTNGNETDVPVYQLPEIK